MASSTRSYLKPLAFKEQPDGSVAVEVHQVVRSLEGDVLSDSQVRHVYWLRDGLVARMEIES